MAGKGVVEPSPRILIVTGGGRGIGAATAVLAGKRGYTVCVNYLQGQVAAEGVVQEIHAAGGTGLAIRADVSDDVQVKTLFDTVDRQLGRITDLVNNAATLETQMRLDQMDVSRFDRIFKTNVFGTMLCSREAVRRMSTKYAGRGGSIVNISSVAARSGAPGEYVDYAASKGAVESFTVGLAKEVAEEDIRVNGVRPGFIYTDIHARGGEPNRVDRVKARAPMRRGGRPEEVAAAIVWLLSDEASYVTGTIIDVAGGS